MGETRVLLLKKKSWAPKPVARKPGQGRKTAAIVALAVGAGAFVVNLVGAKAASGKVQWVVVASTTIPAGSAITANDVTLARIQGFDGGFPKVSDVTGMVAEHGIVTGEPITAGLASHRPLRLGLDPDEVGLWIGVNLVTSALVHPGDIADVIFASNAGGGGSTTSQQQIAAMQGQVLVSGARVVQVANSNGQIIAAQQKSSLTNSANATVPAAVELAVTTQQATQLVSAETLGALTLVEDPWGTSGTTTVSGSVVTGTTGSSTNPVATPSIPPVIGTTPNPAVSTTGTKTTTTTNKHS